MRNLKKFLALVLAMVMAFSLMLTANAATSLSGFQDAEAVTPEFVESVTILAGLDVLKGDGDEDNKTIRPQDEITRAEAAALVYRIVTGDVNDRQVQLYSDYGKFSDVSPDDWFAGYVGYCQNAGIIKGTTPTTFSPYLKVTGYEVLAMILRAVGYGKNNEFTGSQWQVNVASLGKTKHITDSISSAQYNYTLNMNARREIVAELLFRGSMIPQVTWTAISGYNEYKTLLGNNVAGSSNPYNDSLAIEVFGLNRDGWRYGSWGRPELVWTASLNPTSNPRREVAVLPAAASHSFTDLQRECDVAEMLDITNQSAFVLFVDADKRTSSNPITVAGDAVTDAYLIKATDTVTKVGGYGRLTEIYLQEDMDKQYPYYNYWSYWSTDEGSSPNYYLTALDDTIVMIDTYLAKVVSTTEAVLDPAGHVITPARMVVDLYDRDQNQTLRRTIQKASGSKDAWEYSAGDVLSLKGVSDQTAVYNTTRDESWAFTLPQVTVGSSVSNVASTRVLVQNTHVFDITKLSGTQGKQTTVYWNNGKHQVDGQDKTDDLALRMDKAGNNINTTYTWYYDEYGYLLGIDDGSAVSYGVITSIYVSYGADGSTDGVAKAVATVKYADGTTGQETIDYFLAQNRNGTTVNDAMTETNSVSSSVVQLWPYYNVGSENPMKEYANTQPFGIGAPSPKRVTNPGTVYMAPVAASNTQAAKAGEDLSRTENYNVYGILNNNLWKFVKSTGDKTVAIEVAGGNNTDNNSPTKVYGEAGFGGVDNSTIARFDELSGNNGDYAGHWAAANSTIGSGANVGKVSKSLSCINIGASATAPAANGGTSTTITWLDNDTKIMVRNEATGGITCYDGVDALPGDVTISDTLDSASVNKRFNEVDWADTDNDGRADVVYLTGSIQGVTTYGLFYTNDLSASWNGTTAVMHGFWNGEETDLTFVSLDQFNAVKNAFNNGTDSYNGHLFAIRLSNGVVSTVLGKNESGFAEELLYDVTNGRNTSGKSFQLYSGTKQIVNSATAADWEFGTGSLATADYIGTNPYSATTEAVYWTDDAATPVVYNASSNWSLLGATVTAGGNTYRLTPNSKVYGIGSNVVLAEGVTALEYLNHSYTNHVTIVYDRTDSNNNLSVIEMYIQTDPNITPSNPGAGAGSPIASTLLLPTGLSTSTRTAKDAFIKANMLPGTPYTFSIDMSADGDVINPATTVYLPFRAVDAGSSNYDLTIRDASGNVVYTETATGMSAGAHYFYITLSEPAGGGNAGTCSGVWGASGLPAGTYSYTFSTSSGSGYVSAGAGTFSVR